MNTKIAIIGAGPCGLAQLRAFKSAEEAGTGVPEIVCFEVYKSSELLEQASTSQIFLSCNNGCFCLSSYQYSF